MPVKKQPNYRLSGINPLAYMGVEPYTPPQLVTESRNPTVNDLSFNIGTLWTTRNPVTNSIWMMVDINRGPTRAVWVELYPQGSGGANSFPTNSGTAVPVLGVLNEFGTDVIATSGSGNTVTIQLTNGTNGQVLIGGGAAPTWANITSGDGSITITNGPNTIDLTTANSGGVTEIITDSGDVFPIAGVVHIEGGELINTSGSTNILVINLDRGNDGQIPIAATGAATIYANITSNDGSITVTNGPNSIDLSAQSNINPASVCNFFLNNPSTNILNSYSGGISYLGQYVVMETKYDVGGNCYLGDGGGAMGLPATFTAPVTGKYLIGSTINMNNPSSTTIVNQNMQIAVYNGAYDPMGSPKNIYSFNPYTSVNPTTSLTLQVSTQNGECIIDMNSGDALVIQFLTQSGYRLNGSPLSNFNLVTFFWGYRLV